MTSFRVLAISSVLLLAVAGSHGQGVSRKATTTTRKPTTTDGTTKATTTLAPNTTTSGYETKPEETAGGGPANKRPVRERGTKSPAGTIGKRDRRQLSMTSPYGPYHGQFPGYQDASSYPGYDFVPAGQPSPEPGYPWYYPNPRPSPYREQQPLDYQQPGYQGKTSRYQQVPQEYRGMPMGYSGLRTSSVRRGQAELPILNHQHQSYPAQTTGLGHGTDNYLQPIGYLMPYGHTRPIG